MKAAQKLTPASYRSDVFVEWCPGCGNFGVLAALRAALAELQLPPNKVAVFSGIGCSGRITQYLNLFGIHVLHGRPVPYALGAKLANPELTVIAVSGDGDGLGIGAGHFVNAGRRNIDITYILHDNGVYGLTKGQASPTLPRNAKTKALLRPNINDPVNPVALAIISGYTFVARGYAFHLQHLKKLMVEAIRHKGSSFLHILQPCPTYNDLMSKEWYEDGRLYRLEEEGYDPRVKSLEEAWMKRAEAVKKALEPSERIPLGVFYLDKLTPSYEERLAARIPHYQRKPPALQKISLEDDTPNIDIEQLLERYRVL